MICLASAQTLETESNLAGISNLLLASDPFSDF